MEGLYGAASPTLWCVRQSAANIQMHATQIMCFCVVHLNGECSCLDMSSSIHMFWFSSQENAEETISDSMSCSNEMCVTTDCSELNVLMGVMDGLREWHLGQRTERVMVAEEDVLGSVGPEHDTNDIEWRLKIVLRWSLAFFMAARWCKCWLIPHFKFETDIEILKSYLLSHYFVLYVYFLCN